MALSMAALRAPAGLTTRPLALRSSSSRASAVRVVCQAGKKEQSGVMGALALPVATLVATAMLTGAALPGDALAASSSGRVGGSSGFKARKVQQSSPASRSSTSRTTVVNNAVVMAPPVMAPPLFGGFGYGGGFSFMPTFFMPVPFLGNIIGFMFLLFAISAVAGIVRGFLNNGSNKSNKKDDTWGDL